MDIGLYAAKFCGRHLGLYTKKEMVRVCKNIGRELVDLQKLIQIYLQMLCKKQLRNMLQKSM